MHRRSFLAGLMATPFAIWSGKLRACSLVFVNDRKVAKIVVRSMDLPASFPERPKFVVFPRGMTRDGRSSVLPGIEARFEGVGGRTLSWTSSYGNAAMVGFDGGASDGLNEKGLAAHMLVLAVSRHEPPDGRLELPDALWAQYVLENFATVKEVVDAHTAGKFRVVASWSADLGMPRPLGLHLAVEDPSGDSAIFEYVGGKLVIHHGPEFRIMTNDPPLDEMLTRMRNYKELGGSQEPPGAATPENRFARLSAYYQYLPDPADYTQAVAGALSLLRIAQVPFRDPAREPAGGQGLEGVQTNWVSAADVSNGIYYINSATVPSLFWLELDTADFAPGAEIAFLDPHDPKIGGDAKKFLRPWKPAATSGSR
jgi:penicillin V acylase-like amidase (Ntn superfamily)